MQTITEWRYFTRGTRVIIALCLASFCVATSTHVLDLLRGGMYRVGGIPAWINYFWLALTFADPLAALALIACVPVGILAMLAIIYADVAINAWVSVTLAGPASLGNLFFVCQAGFLAFITAAALPLLRSVNRCVIAESGRLFLRPLRRGDAGELARIFTDPDSMKWYPRPFTESETKGWIARNRARYRRFGFGLWAIVLKDSGRCIGDCGVTFQCIDGEWLPEIGYHVIPELRGKGIAVEASRMALDYWHHTFGCRDIYSYCEEGNLPSRRVMEKLGFAFLKRYDDAGTEKVVYRLKKECL